MSDVTLFFFFRVCVSFPTGLWEKECGLYDYRVDVCEPSSYKEGGQFFPSISVGNDTRREKKERRSRWDIKQQQQQPDGKRDEGPIIRPDGSHPSFVRGSADCAAAAATVEATEEDEVSSFLKKYGPDSLFFSYSFFLLSDNHRRFFFPSCFYIFLLSAV